MSKKRRALLFADTCPQRMHSCFGHGFFRRRAAKRQGRRKTARRAVLPAHGLYMNRLWYEGTPELKACRLDE